MKARIKSGTVPYYLTIGKEYEITRFMDEESSKNLGRLFGIMTDVGMEVITNEHHSSHLGGGSWEIIGESKEKGVRGFFRRLFGLNK